MTRKNRAVALAIIFAMVLLLISPFEVSVRAAGVTLDGGVIVIDEQFILDNGGETEYIITGDVFSVTVIGDIDVSLIFDNVTIDRSSDTAGTNITGLYDAGKRLYDNGWTSRPNTSTYYVPTCPLLVTGGASATVRFDGNCTFKAGYNGWHAGTNNNLQLTSDNHCGYAGIQVDSGASLTISSAENLEAYGAYQMASSDSAYVNAVRNGQTVYDTSGNVITVGDGSFDIEDIIAYNSKPFKSGSYDTGAEGYGAPDGSSPTTNCGGAGIGGGAAYNTTSSSGTGYTAGTPGTIIINTGAITAFGGHTAAGIGGGLNGAATSDKIEINGGNITAVAGRWSAAIGDGDSISGNTSSAFDETNDNSYEIIINGGVINAYGGLSASAIGTTDEVTNSGNKKISGLSITIAAGSITARSGESYDGGTTSTAAIGAGNGTDMNDNCITIYNEATIVASGFSNYAISNYGTDTTGTKVPSVNIDPEGYVYLARFEDDAAEREFKIYSIRHNANGHFVYVPTTAADIADGSIDSMTNDYYYAYDPGYVSSDGANIGGFYLTDQNGVNVIPEDYETVPENYIYDEDTGRYYPNTIPALSAYYDKNSFVETITVPGNYKAVAITLPKPAEYGGAYVLEVPKTNETPTYVLMQKDYPGVTSGEIDKISDTHYIAGVNPPTDSNRTPNIEIDGTAKPFVDLDVGVYENEVKQETLIPEFTDTVYGYTFYVPHGTEKFWLDFSFESSYTDDLGNAATAKIILLTVNGLNQAFDENSTAISLSELVIGADGRADVWIKKTDTITSGGSSKTVSYKITIIVKDKYDFVLNVSALSKVYDSNPVIPNFTALLDGMGYTTEINKNSLTITYASGDNEYDTSSYNFALSGYIVYYSISGVTYFSDGSATYEVLFTTSATAGTMSATYKCNIDKDGNITYIDDYAISGEVTSGRTSYRIYISNNGSAITLRLQQRSGNWGSWRNSGSAATVAVSANVTKMAGTATDISVVEEELKNKIAENGTSSENATVQNYTENGTLMYIVKIGSINDTILAEYSNTGTASVTVTYSEGTNLTSKMTNEEREAVVYTFYQDSDGDGIYETLLGSTAPKNTGKYKVIATLEASKYEAEGECDFEIFKREINIVAIQNWLKYIELSEVASYDGVIPDPGTIYYENVVSGETIGLENGATFGYVDRGNAGYSDDITYDDKKIIITNPVLDAASGINYTLVGLMMNGTDRVCYVPGQIAYSTASAMFRKALDGTNGANSLWRKFYPVDLAEFLNWTTDSNGNFIDTKVDYHSPVPNGANADNGFGGGTVGIHREYVKLRTTGDTSERYSVDIEFGAMQFEYTKTIWNVNTGEYEAVDGESKWNGNNGSNNSVTVTNYSNADIYYQIEFEIDFMYAAISADADSGIRAALYDDSNILIAGSQNDTKITSTAGTSNVQCLLSAAPIDHSQTGRAISRTFVLVLSGVPSSITEDNNVNYTNVGYITVTLVAP